MFRSIMRRIQTRRLLGIPPKDNSFQSTQPAKEKVYWPRDVVEKFGNVGQMLGDGVIQAWRSDISGKVWFIESELGALERWAAGIRKVDTPE